MSSTEKLTFYGRAVARTRDRYRDNLLSNGKISMREYRTVLRALNEVKYHCNAQMKELMARINRIEHGL